MPLIRICVVITDKAQLSRLLTLLRELSKSKHFELQIAMGGSALTYRFGNILEELKSEGFEPNVCIPTVIEGAGHLGMAKTAALAMLEFATAFEQLQSDMVVIRGDRFEMLPIATAAAYLNKTVVHLEGGDKSGSIDESVRHAITKLAHVHFVTNADSRKRVISMGEPSKYVFNVGSLDIDYLTKTKFLKMVPSSIVNNHGTGALLDLNEDYIVVMHNPVTSEAEQARDQVEATLDGVMDSGLQAVWIWPNLDAGSDDISKRIREWQVANPNQDRIRFIRYLVPGEFINVVNHSQVMVGNSSTGIKECAWLGIPAVNIGSRQRGRLRARNVMDVKHNAGAIEKAILEQAAKKRYQSAKLYGDGSTAKSIVKILRGLDVEVQKGG